MVNGLHQLNQWIASTLLQVQRKRRVQEKNSNQTSKAAHRRVYIYRPTYNFRIALIPRQSWKILLNKER